MADSTVSAIIPTLHRPTLLMRALDSVFRQTHPVAEIIVVVDGPDPDTMAALQDIKDPRLQVIQNSHSLTAAGARNLAASKATGAWIAFLDDDDEWLPQKIEKQLELASARHARFVTCQSNILTPLGSYVWPEAIYDGRQSFDEYLFNRRSPVAGRSFVQTSSYLIRRELYLTAPFRIGTPHDDWDFLLSLTNRLGVPVETVPETLVNVYMEESRPSLSHRDSWRASLTWADEVRPLLQRRSYSAFCLGVVGSRAADAHDWRAFPLILYKACRHGTPGIWQLAFYFAFWIIPIGTRRQLRAAFLANKAPA